MQVAGIACLCTNMDVFGSGTVNRTVNGMGLPRYQRSNKKIIDFVCFNYGKEFDTIIGRAEVQDPPANLVKNKSASGGYGDLESFNSTKALTETGGRSCSSPGSRTRAGWKAACTALPSADSSEG